ncbi:MAG: polyphosphate kinase 2 family protein [Christensenellaceae bacterium]|nr:polyphosphate kinase 2 family protein [Christensenellaceae bacterium]
MSVKDYRYDGSDKLVLKRLPTGAQGLSGEKADYVRKTKENIAKAAALQEKLYASGREGLVIAIQARDAAGKDSLIKKVFSGLNPAALEVHAFKTPSKEELSHDYLWRLNRALPPRGKIGVFNRSHYEDVLVTRVHRMEKGYLMPERVTGDRDFYQKRYRQLRNWEQYLYENGYRVVKLLLNIGKEEQKKRFIDRLELPEKHWKLSINDMAERALWEAYDEAYEDAVNATATKESPWYVLPADDKWYTRYLVSQILVDTLEEMDVSYPPIDPVEAAQIPVVMEELMNEKR